MQFISPEAGYALRRMEGAKHIPKAAGMIDAVPHT
jgi:hypothetical protein